MRALDLGTGVCRRWVVLFMLTSILRSDKRVARSFFPVLVSQRTKVPLSYFSCVSAGAVNQNSLVDKRWVDKGPSLLTLYTRWHRGTIYMVSPIYRVVCVPFRLPVSVAWQWLLCVMINGFPLMNQSQRWLFAHLDAFAIRAREVKKCKDVVPTGRRQYTNAWTLNLSSAQELRTYRRYL